MPRQLLSSCMIQATALPWAKQQWTKNTILWLRSEAGPHRKCSASYERIPRTHEMDLIVEATREGKRKLSNKVGNTGVSKPRRHGDIFSSWCPAARRIGELCDATRASWIGNAALNDFSVMMEELLFFFLIPPRSNPVRWGTLQLVSSSMPRIAIHPLIVKLG